MLVSVLISAVLATSPTAKDYGVFTQMAQDLEWFDREGFFFSRKYWNRYRTPEERYPQMIISMAVQSDIGLTGKPPAGLAIGIAEYLLDHSQGYRNPAVIPLLAKDIEIAFWHPNAQRRSETKWYRHNHNLISMASREDYTVLIRAIEIDLDNKFSISENDFDSDEEYESSDRSDSDFSDEFSVTWRKKKM